MHTDALPWLLHTTATVLGGGVGQQRVAETELVGIQAHTGHTSWGAGSFTFMPVYFFI